MTTHASLQANQAVLTLPNAKKSLRLVDIPGHPRLFDQFKDHIAEAKAVVFVVDASSIARNGPSTAEQVLLIHIDRPTE